VQGHAGTDGLVEADDHEAHDHVPGEAGHDDEEDDHE
jgi:hypothetical protein